MKTSIFGQRVLLLRREKGLTQAELAESAHVSSNTVARLERGVFQDLMGEKIRLLADRLGVSMDYLVGRTHNDDSVDAKKWVEFLDHPTTRKCLGASHLGRQESEA